MKQFPPPSGGDGRKPETPNVWKDATEYVDAVKRSYRRDNWQTQPNYCEIWSEKATILGAIRPVANEWGSRCVDPMVRQHRDGIAGRHVVPGNKAGHYRVLPRRPRPERPCPRARYSPPRPAASGVDFRMVRLAIHDEDIAALRLPPQAIKTTDSRAASLRRRFGDNAATAELDALPAAELRRRVNSAVEGLVDHTLWDHQLMVQQVELNCIAEVAEPMKSLPQLGEQ
jgi:hypothetical protein